MNDHHFQFGTIIDANGIYQDCGYDLPVAVNITCEGPAYSALTSFSCLTCATVDIFIVRNNDVTCPDTLSTSSIVSICQPLNITTIESITSNIPSSMSNSPTDTSTPSPAVQSFPSLFRMMSVSSKSAKSSDSSAHQPFNISSNTAFISMISTSSNTSLLPVMQYVSNIQ